MAEREEAEWRQVAFDVYRLARLVIDDARDSARPEVQFYLDELREALLDLKEATIQEDPSRAMDHVAEVRLLLAELRLRLNG